MSRKIRRGPPREFPKSEETANLALLLLVLLVVFVFFVFIFLRRELFDFSGVAVDKRDVGLVDLRRQLGSVALFSQPRIHGALKQRHGEDQVFTRGEAGLVNFSGKFREL